MSLFSFLGDVVKGGVDLATGNIPGAIKEGANALGTFSGGSPAGAAVGAATTAAGNNRLDQEKLALQANTQNTSGMSAVESALMARAAEEDAQRKTALRQLLLKNSVENPAHSPFDPVPAGKPNAALAQALGDLSTQDASMLAKPSSTQVSSMAPVSYTPLSTNAQQLQKQTGTAPSLLEKIGDVAGPGLTLAGIGLNGAAARSGQPGSVPGPVGPMSSPVVGANAGLFNIPGMTQGANGLYQLPPGVLTGGVDDGSDDSYAQD